MHLPGGRRSVRAGHPVETAFQIIKFAGATYLIYLAWKAWRSGDAEVGRHHDRRRASGASLPGMLTSLTTPKWPCSPSWRFCRCSSIRRAAALPARIIFLGLLFSISGTT